jgi:hypothetical protein
MPSQKIVRCEVVRPGMEAGSLRYIPLEIFGLWSYLMENKHGFRMASNEISLWIDLDESPEMAYGEAQHEPVTEISLFVYSDPAGMFTRVSRYFPTAEYSSLKPIFLSHYISPEAAGGAEPPIREKSGLWIRRHLMAS